MLLQNKKINQIRDRILKEFLGWSKFESIFLVFSLIVIVISSIIIKDSILSIITAICGILYTIIAGKGKISCYFFGIICCLLCAYLSFKAALYGNFALHLFYYFPMEIIGIYQWNKHLKKETKEIIKTKLPQKEFLKFNVLILIFTPILYFIFTRIGDNCPFIDAFMSVLSIFAMILTVKRCSEQWILWTIVNILSVLMWFSVFSQGEKIFAILMVRIIYLILGVYFFIKWKKESESYIDNEI